jgi:hypothetical protein
MTDDVVYLAATAASALSAASLLLSAPNSRHRRHDDLLSVQLAAAVASGSPSSWGVALSAALDGVDATVCRVREHVETLPVSRDGDDD